MSYTFERPVRAAMDVRELEYITALLQTRHDDQDAFRDASIEATDVKNYLMSRHGIEISKEKVLELIFYDLAGGNSADESLDIPEIVSILLIPYLRRIAVSVESDSGMDARDTMVSKFEKDAYERKMGSKLAQSQFNSKIIGKVLNIILLDTTGSVDPPPLTKKLIRDIFSAYDEDELINDEKLLEDMVAMAAGENQGENGTVLDAQAFARALTNDLGEYNQDLETKFTTHYEDVFGLVTVENEQGLVVGDLNEETEETAWQEEGGPVKFNRVSLHNARDENLSKANGDFRRVFTYPQVDNFADPFRDKTQHVLVWLSVILAYISYFNPSDSYGIEVCPEERRDELGCQVLLSISVWFTVLGIMLVIMAPAVLILSLGNNVHRHNPLEILAGIIGIVVLIFFPALYHKLDNKVVTTATIEDAAYFSTLARTFNIIIGSILLFFQFCNIIRWIIPDSKLVESKFLSLVLRGSGVRSEFGIKQATLKKVDRLVTNAYELHIEEREGYFNNQSRSGPSDVSGSKCLLNYMKLSENRETCGGFIWAWKAFLTDGLVEGEGIWMHTRLLAGNAAQFVISIGLAFFGFFVALEIVNEMYPSEVVPQSNRCGSFVDPTQCVFPSYEFNDTIYSTGMGVCQNVRLTNSSCIDDFITIPEDVQKEFCDILSSATIMPDFNQYIDADNVLQYLNEDLEACPDLYIPYPSEIVTAFEGSETDKFCVAPITVCTPTDLNSKGEHQGNCIIGNRNSVPFQFRGEFCTNYTSVDEDYSILHSQKVAYADAIEDGMPTKEAVQASLGIGLSFSFIAGLVNAAVNIPSQITTTLKFRSGVIESLRDKDFLKLRGGMLNLTYLLGASVWGAVIMTITAFLLFTVLSFFFIYHVTRPYAVQVLSVFIGVLTTLAVKILMSLFLNKYTFVGFYRKRPVLANIANVVFECWHLAVTATFMLMRAVKLIIIVIFYLGRFDRPILAKGVGDIGPIAFDNYPNIFAKDLLAIDAHRHPYIERLGMMYLMKLKHGNNFARRTGSIWRLLFVFALMPYLRKNRIAAIAMAKD